MKKTFLLLTILVCLFGACKEDESVYLDVNAGSSGFNFATTEGSQEFTISSNAAWTVSSDAAWCSASPASGSGNASVRVTVAANTEYADRSAKVTVSANGADSKVISVSQTGNKPAFAVSAPSGFKMEGGKDTLYITGNVKWTLAQDNGSQSWCRVSATSGERGAATVTVTADANNNPGMRAATFTFTADQMPAPTVVEEVQFGEERTLIVSPATINVSGVEQVVKVDVTSNLEYTVTPNVDWIEKTTAPAGVIILKTVATNAAYFKIKANTGASSHTGTVSFAAGTNTATLTVNQTNMSADVLADSLALVQIYNKSKELADAPWTSASTPMKNWNTAQPLKNWSNVVLNSDGRVIKLTLGANNANVAIVDAMDFSPLSELRSLDIFFRPNIDGSAIPASIGKLSKLKRLFIRVSSTTAKEEKAIPATLYDLTELTFLELSSGVSVNGANSGGYSFIKDDITPAIGKMSKLDTLYLNGNKIASIEGLGSLKALTFVQMKANAASAPLPASIGSATALKKIDMTYALSGTIPTEIGNLTNLEYLDLSNNAFDHTAQAGIPASIEKLTKLTVLNLNNSRLTGPIPANIGNLTALTVLNLQSNSYTVSGQAASPGLTGEIPSGIGSLTKLTTLNLATNSLSGTIPGSIGSLPALTTFSVAQNKFTGVGAGIGSLKIGVLNFSDNALTSVSESNFPNATQLNLSNNQLVSGGFPAVITAPLLTTITLSNNKLDKIPDGVLKVGSLTSLPVNGNPLDASKMTNDMSALTKLTSINLVNSTLKAIPECLASAPALTAIDLSGCSVTSIPNVEFPYTKTLTLNSNGLTTLPENINKFTALTSLSLNANKLTSVPAAVIAIPTLTVFSATNNQITEIPANWSSITNLTLNNNLLTTVPSGLTSVVYLDLNYNKFTSIPSNIYAMTTLTYLSMSYNEIAGAMPASLKSLVNLKSLYLNNNKMTGKIPNIFGPGGIPTGSTNLNNFLVQSNRLEGFDADVSMTEFKKMSTRTVCPQNDPTTGVQLTTCPIVVP